MTNEPVYTSQITEHDHEYKSGLVKTVKRFVATIVGEYNGIPIAHKTEIYNIPFIESLEKEKLYNMYNKTLDDYKKYQPELN